MNDETDHEQGLITTLSAWETSASSRVLFETFKTKRAKRIASQSTMNMVPLVVDALRAFLSSANGSTSVH